MVCDTSEYKRFNCSRSCYRLFNHLLCIQGCKILNQSYPIPSFSCHSYLPISIINILKSKDYEKIYLQTQGSSNNLNTNNSINSHLSFHISIRKHKDDNYIIAISKGQTRINIDKIYHSLPSVFRKIEREFKNSFNEDIKISNTIERYCHSSYNILHKKYLACCFYDKNTETIRLYPNNEILVSFRDKGTDNYLQTNQATAKYFHILKEEAERHEKEKDWCCHIGKSEDFLRERYTWLIGEAIKKEDNNVQFKITNTLIIK